MKIELIEAILHTGGKTAEQLRTEYGDVTDEEIAGYLKILAAMDGQRAFVSPSLSSPDEYDYMGLFDESQGKEIAYLRDTGWGKNERYERLKQADYFQSGRYSMMASATSSLCVTISIVVKECGGENHV